MKCTDQVAGVIRVQAALNRETHEPDRGGYSELTMSDTITNCGTRNDAQPGRLGNRLSVKEIAHRLDIGRLAVYTMLEQGLLPGTNGLGVNLIDRLFAWLSPAWARRRCQARPVGFGQIRDNALRVSRFSFGVRLVPRCPTPSAAALDCSPLKRVHGDVPEPGGSLQ